MNAQDATYISNVAPEERRCNGRGIEKWGNDMRERDQFRRYCTSSKMIIQVNIF